MSTSFPGLSTPVVAAHRSSTSGSPDAKPGDGPPRLEFVRRFFADHRRKVFLLGVVAVLAGLAVLGLNVLSFGISLPFTLHLSLALIGFGVAAIGTALAFNGLESADVGQPATPPRKKIKPRGHRAASIYLTRQIRPRVVNAKPIAGGKLVATATCDVNGRQI